MSGTKSFSLVSALFILFASACSAQLTQPTPTYVSEPTFTPPPARPPATEAEVPRVTTGDAKAALDSGAAVIVDVRSPASFETSHIAGAISIPLADIEANPDGLNFAKDQWIITYCT
jgi:3-mercaptopyruvate sulfurtransferase SseA